VPTVVGADLHFSLEQDGTTQVRGHLTGEANRLRLEVDDPGVFAGAGDAAAIRSVARGLADRGVVLQVVSGGDHLVSLGDVRVRWWQRRMTRSPHIKLGSLKGAWTSARAQASGRRSVLPGSEVLPPATLWPPAPTFMRRPVKRVGATHDPGRGGSPRLVLVKDSYFPGEGQPVYWLEEGMRIGSRADCDIRLDGLEPVQASLEHDEADEWVLVAEVGRTRVNGTATDRQVLRTGTRIEMGDHVLVYSRAEYADHGRPHGGRIGGEAGRQEPQAPRRTGPPAFDPD